jgi:hypothetical protein
MIRRGHPGVCGLSTPETYPCTTPRSERGDSVCRPASLVDQVKQFILTGLAPRHKDLLDPFKAILNDRAETADWQEHQEKHHLLSYRPRFAAASRLESS